MKLEKAKGSLENRGHEFDGEGPLWLDTLLLVIYLQNKPCSFQL